MALRRTDPESYITECTLVYENKYRGVCRVEGIVRLGVPAAFQLAVGQLRTFDNQ